jgi:hypothetical protein
MNCTAFEGMVMPVVMGAQAPAERAEAHAHLLACRDCLAAFLDAKTVYEEALTATERAPAALRARVFASAATVRRSGIRNRIAARPRLALGFFSLGAAAAGLSALLWTGATELATVETPRADLVIDAHGDQDELEIGDNDESAPLITLL